MMATPPVGVPGEARGGTYQLPWGSRNAALSNEELLLKVMSAGREVQSASRVCVGAHWRCGMVVW